MASFALSDPSTTEEINNSPILSALGHLWNGRYEMWSSRNLTYTLNIGDNNPDGEAVGLWTDALSAAISTAHADIEAISQLTFTEVPDSVNGTDGADIDYWAYDNPNDGAAGFSYGVAGPGVYIDMADVYAPDASTGDGLEYGGINYLTVIHELLHNLGMSHPHDGAFVFPGVTSPWDTGDHALNQNLYTVLSYNSVRQLDANGDETTGYPFTFNTVDRSLGVLGTFDIAFIQTLYGANMAHATGDDVYVLPDANAAGTHYKAIWDAGGTDEFRYDGSDDAVIDLRAATLDPEDGMLAGGIVSKAAGIYGGLNIAKGVVIENATGGAGNDILFGNAFANRLTGGSGADTLDGGAGDDLADLSSSAASVLVDLETEYGAGGDAEGDVFVDIEGIVGSENDDTLYGSSAANSVFGNGGHDVIHAGGGNDTLQGGQGDDSLQGGTGSDSIDGGAGHDWVQGGAGADDMTGGEGFDWLDYSVSQSRVVVNLGTGDAAGGDAQGDAISGFEAVTGSSYSDRLTGDDADNVLEGGRGNDTLDGGLGDDTLYGDAGRDTFIFNTGENEFHGGDGEDRVLFENAASRYTIIDLSAGNWQIQDLVTTDMSVLFEIERLVFDEIVFI